ncbi:hypothetical protein OnM2_013024 [Erysiphe neolycopersici]|uniref:Uncharacterized protein n=1 Tax=Erysiphe neolycopersici TaxID=212602 RepID=A0A420I5U0_9PEZI|nr:hypothetical protein OnM2_013024 [Erysiphe neolycopersici]
MERITKGNKEPATVKPKNLTTNNMERDQFSVPCSQAIWNPDRGQFKAPEKYTDWTAKLGHRIIVIWLRKYWCELVIECDLDKSTLDVRNSDKPIRPSLKPLSITQDLEI